MLFSSEHYRRFTNEIADAGCSVPILPGTRLLKSREQAARMAARFAVEVPASYLARLAASEADPSAQQASVDAALELINDLRNAGAPGIHLFVLSDTELSSLTLKRALNRN